MTQQRSRNEAEIQAQVRRAQWLRLTSLLPPDERGFVPRTQEPEDDRPPPANPEPKRQEVEPYPHWPKWSLPTRNWQTDLNPGWENVVRAYEEDR